MIKGVAQHFRQYWPTFKKEPGPEVARPEDPHAVKPICLCAHGLIRHPKRVVGKTELSRSCVVSGCGCQQFRWDQL